MVNQGRKQHTSSTSSAPNEAQAQSSGSSQNEENRSVSTASQASSSKTITAIGQAEPLNQQPIIAFNEAAAVCVAEGPAPAFEAPVFEAPAPAHHINSLIALAASSEWDRVESLGEMVSQVSPLELRLLAACVEGALRANIPQLHHFEARANKKEFVEGLLMQNGRMTYPDSVDHVFLLVTLLNAKNRQLAYLYIHLIGRLMADRVVQLPRLPRNVQVEVLQKLGKLVTAALYHPAFSVDQQVLLSRARDDLKNQLDTYTIPEEPPRPQAPRSPQILFIEKFSAFTDTGDFTIEVLWNDGACTWVHRSRDEIASLHRRLLDLFGEETREGATSSSTHSRPSSRILPLFKPDGSDSDFIHYIHSLSDLPARMMLSAPISEEFYSSRSADVSGSRVHWPVTGSPPPGMPSPTPLMQSDRPLCYLPNGPPPGMNPLTCSNCAGKHLYVHCDKKNIMVRTGPDGQEIKEERPKEPQQENFDSPTARVNPTIPAFFAYPPPFPMIHPDPNHTPMFYPCVQYVNPQNRNHK